MSRPVVPGCPVRHTRRVYLAAAAALLALFVVALVWPSWWSISLLAAGGYAAAFHPACRMANRRFGYGTHDPHC